MPHPANGIRSPTKTSSPQKPKLHFQSSESFGSKFWFNVLMASLVSSRRLPWPLPTRAPRPSQLLGEQRHSRQSGSLRSEQARWTVCID